MSFINRLIIMDFLKQQNISYSNEAVDALISRLDKFKKGIISIDDFREHLLEENDDSQFAISVNNGVHDLVRFMRNIMVIE